MTQQHLITPSPELVVQWIKEFSQPNDPRWQEYEQDIATRAAQWGADQELEACLYQLQRWGIQGVDNLRNTRRPKAPSLKEQALALINHDPANQPFLSDKGIDTIRRALEQLPDNE
jgi:hypothetical protein